MTHPDADEAPPAIAQMADQARDYVTKAINFQVDGTHDTLPVVDHYLSEVPKDQPVICELIASAVGCYFGEILREQFDARWVMEGDNPAAWRLEVTGCTVSLFPVGMAYQAMLGGQHEDRFDDSIHVDDEDKPGLAEALERVTKVRPEVYYSLCNRFDTLEYVVDLLMARQAKLRQDEEQEDNESGEG